MAENDTPLLALKPTAVPPPTTSYAISCAVRATITTVLVGYNVAVTSGAEIYLIEDLGLNDTQIEVLLGIINIYSLLGALLAGWTADRFGRRLGIILANIFFLLGAATMSLANGYAALMAGRFLAGIGTGFGLVISSIYAAEISPASARGLLGSLPEIFINGGILLSYVSNYAFSSLPVYLGWRLMFAAGAIPPVFFVAGMLAMPESPYWLVLQGRDAEAGHVLEKLSSNPAEAGIRLSEIKGTAFKGATGDTPGTGSWMQQLRRNPVNVRIVATVLALQFFQQACGTDTIVQYSPRVFRSAGMVSNASLLVATIFIGAIKFVCIFVAVFLIDRAGRRPLLLASAAGMAVSLLTLGTTLLVVDHGGPSTTTLAACIASVAATVGTFSIGFGPLAAVYCSEILPLRLRAVGMALGAVINRVMCAIVTMTFISLYEAITVAGSFFLYAGVATAALVFVYFGLSETRGRTLEDIEEHHLKAPE